MAARLLLCLVTMFPVLALAQKPTPEAVAALANAWRAHRIVVSGASNPELIPDGVALELAFNRLAAEQASSEQAFRQNLRARFTGSDLELERVSAVALSSADFAATVRAEESARIDKACSDVVGTEPWQSLDAVALARRFADIEATRLQAIEAHYKAVIAQLSQPMRSALLSYVDTDVRASAVWTS